MENETEQLLNATNQGVTETTNIAVQIILSLVPLAGIIFGSTLIFFFLLWNYKLRKELIRSGQYRSTSVRNLRILALLTALMSIAAGIPLTLLFWAINGISYVLLGGLIPLFVGIGLLVFYILAVQQE